MRYYILLFLLYSFAFMQAQDTIVVYEFATQNTSLIPPVAYDTNQVFDHTNFSIGNMGNPTNLSTNPPTTNLFPNSHFSNIARAELFHDLTDYPIRTAVNLINYQADTSLGSGCSGIMVGPDLVLTAAHCVRSVGPSPSWHADSILIAPAYNNGQFQANLPTSFVKKAYLFQENYNGSVRNETALLQLRSPIGLDIGWIGTAYSSDTNYFHNKVFHKLSYPGNINHMDSSKVYNGDTLFYNYGYIDNFVSPYAALGVIGAWGIGGQSGSSLFYTDNMTAYYSFGVMTFASDYRHSHINQQMFYQLQNIIDNYGYTIPIKRIPNNNNWVKISPNPFRERTEIEFNNPSLIPYRFQLIDITGKVVQSILNITNNVVIHKKDLPNGIYFFYLSAKEKSSIVGKLQIQD